MADHVGPVTPELNADTRTSIDGMTAYEMLRVWKFSPLGYFQTGDAYSKYFQEVMLAKKAANPAAFVRASKDLSW